MTETWFTSDLHFGHKFMADLRGIGRDKLAEHDEMLIENWRSVVGSRDTVHFLGDFSFHPKTGGANEKIFAALTGIKHLKVGNHDPSGVRALPWASVENLEHISIEGQKFVLCHYPMLTWANAHKGVLHLHGHTHGNLKADLVSSRMDVGVDCHPEHRPFNISECLEILKDRPYDYVDHHTEASAAREGASGGGVWGFPS